MTEIAAAARFLRAWFTNHRVELGLAVRVSISAVVSLAVAQLLNLPIPLWSVLTAVILTQTNVGRSLKVTSDYMAATLGAAIYAGAIGVFVPHNTELSLLGALAVAVAPAAALAAFRPRFSAAPFTAVLVFLAPSITHAGPFEAAFDRMAEVIVGGLVGVVVSLLVLPARARDLATEAAADVLGLMAQRVSDLFGQLTRHADASQQSQNDISDAFAQLDAVTIEAKHERLAQLFPGTSQVTLVAALRRLRHDLIIIGRAARVALPDVLQARVCPSLTRVGESISSYLRGCAMALLEQSHPPPLDAVASAMASYAIEATAVRRDGLTRDLSIDTAEHVFVLNFALDQLNQDLSELGRCLADLASPHGTSARLAATRPPPSPPPRSVRTDTDAPRSGS